MTPLREAKGQKRLGQMRPHITYSSQLREDMVGLAEVPEMLPWAARVKFELPRYDHPTGFSPATGFHAGLMAISVDADSV